MQLTAALLVSILSLAVETLGTFPQEHDLDINAEDARLTTTFQNGTHKAFDVSAGAAAVPPFSSTSLTDASARFAPLSLASTRGIGEKDEEISLPQGQPQVDVELSNSRVGSFAESSSSHVNTGTATPSMTLKSLQQQALLNAFGTPKEKHKTSEATENHQMKWSMQGLFNRVPSQFYNKSFSSRITPSSLFIEEPQFEGQSNHKGSVQNSEALLRQRRQLLSKLAQSARGRKKRNKSAKNDDAHSGSSEGENEEMEQVDSMQAEVPVTGGDLSVSKTHFFQSATQLMSAEQGEGGLPPRWKLSARKSLGSEVMEL